MDEKIGDRLRSERKRLGHTQASFAELCEVATITQMYYETNKRNPDTKYLLKAMSAGADIYYILKAVHNVVTLDPRETALLDNYRNSPEEGQRFIEQAALRETERNTQNIAQKITRKPKNTSG